MTTHPTKPHSFFFFFSLPSKVAFCNVSSSASHKDSQQPFNPNTTDLFDFSHDYQQPSTWPKSTPPSPVITPTPVLPTMIAHKLPNDSFYHTSPPLFLFEVTIKGRKNWEKNRIMKTNLKNNKMNYLCIFPCFAGDDGSHRWHRKKEEWRLIQIPIVFVSLVAAREPMSQQWW